MFNIKIQYYNNARIYSNKVELSVERVTGGDNI